MLLRILLKFQNLRQYSDLQSLPYFNSFEGLEVESLEALNGGKVIQGVALGQTNDHPVLLFFLFSFFGFSFLVFCFDFFLKEKYDVAPKNSSNKSRGTLKP
jgi:hypothetical protein